MLRLHYKSTRVGGASYRTMSTEKYSKPSAENRARIKQALGLDVEPFDIKGYIKKSSDVTP